MNDKGKGIWSKVLAFGLVFLMTTGGVNLLVSQRAEAAAREEVVLRVAMQDDVKTLNPLVAGDVWTWNVLGYLYDTPTNVDLINPDRFIPYIARRSANFTATSIFNFDNKSDWQPLAKVAQITVYYDFTNVKFHDGHQMDINDVLFSFYVQAMLPDWAASVKCLMDKGGEAGSNYSDTRWLAIDKYWESADGLQAALRFYQQTAYADFIRNTLSVFLLPQHIWSMKAAGQDVDNADPRLPPLDPRSWKSEKALAWSNPSPVGSGPFKFESWTPGQQAKVVTYRDHFYQSQPTIDAILFRIYKTAEQAVQALQQGDIDYIAWSIPPTYVPDLMNDDKIGISQASERGFFYMSFNMRRKSFGYLDNDPLKGDYGLWFRKAVAYCVNKKEIVERLLQNFGIAADGPVSAIDTEWYNNSLPQYSFDPEMAKRLLQDHGYKLTNPGSPPGKGNWWLNPDGTQIGNGDGGLIEILTPPADYDPIRAQAGIMIATQLQEVGIRAESVALDFGTIVQRIERRDFDMFILGWRIGSDPTDFLYAFFDSANADSGQNYPGYRNQTFDKIIENARQTGDSIERKKDVRDAQASVAYDQPYNVLYYRTNIEAYRADRFVNWTLGSTGSIFSWRSIMGIHPPSQYQLKAQLSVESPVPSEGEVDVVVTVKDQANVAVQGAYVAITCNNGTFVENGLKQINGTTSSNGQFVKAWKAPKVPQGGNDTSVSIQLMTATKTDTSVSPARAYDPASSKVSLIIVKPVGAQFMRMKLDVSTDVITAGENTPITVTVRDQDGNPVSGATISTELSATGPTVTGDTTTSADGTAQLTLTAPAEVTENQEVSLTVTASHTEFTSEVSQSVNVQILKPTDGGNGGDGVGGGIPSIGPVAVLGVMASVAIVGGYFVYGRKKSQKNKGR